MERAFKVGLNWSEERIAEYLKSFQGDELLAIQAFLDRQSSDPRTTGLLLLAKYRIILVKNGWVAKYGAKSEEMFELLSPLESKVAFTRNPFYLMFAFDIPFVACIALIKQFEILVTDDILAHAILMHALKSSHQVTVGDFKNMCVRQGSVVVIPNDVSLCKPFGDALCGHVLEHDDISKEPPGQMAQHVKDKNALRSLIREKTNMTNRIVCKDGVYSLMNNFKEACQIIKFYKEKDVMG